MTEMPRVFNRHHLRLRRDRATAGFDREAGLFTEIGARLLDRLLDVTRSFSNVLDLGARTGPITAQLAANKKVGHLVAAELSAAMLTAPGLQNLGTPRVQADEEWLPFAEHSFDLVFSLLSLHSTNDLPGALIQIRRALKPDGLLLAALFGGATLHELRTVMTEAESDVSGGVTPRVAPFADVRDAGNLMVRAGFGLPVADTDLIEVTYSSFAALLTDIRALGETNIIADRAKGLCPKGLLAKAAALYEDRYATPSGRITATFEVIYLTGWAPSGSQQTPLRPGSATHRLADALGTDENPL